MGKLIIWLSTSSTLASGGMDVCWGGERVASNAMMLQLHNMFPHIRRHSPIFYLYYLCFRQEATLQFVYNRISRQWESAYVADLSKNVAAWASNRLLVGGF